MLILYAILTCFMIAVILSDISRYIIPNWLVLALTVLYPVAVLLSPARPDWRWACVIALITFVIGYIIVVTRLMGAGDIKLLTATALYAGPGGMIDFVVYVAILGGLGSILLLMLRVLVPFLCLKLGKGADTIPRVLSHGQPVPYGVAIAIAFLIMLWNGHLPGLIL